MWWCVAVLLQRARDFSLWQLPTGSIANVQLQVQCEDENGALFWLNESTGEIEPMQLLDDDD